MTSWFETYKPAVSSRTQLLLAAALWGIVGTMLLTFGTAKKIAYRIVQRGEGRCVGGFFSLRSWALVVCMIVLGRLLRGTSVPLHLLGLLYAAVGTGLLISSRSIWLAWKDQGEAES